MKLSDIFRREPKADLSKLDFLMTSHDQGTTWVIHSAADDSAKTLQATFDKCEHGDRLLMNVRLLAIARTNQA